MNRTLTYKALFVISALVLLLAACGPALSTTPFTPTPVGGLPIQPTGTAFQPTDAASPATTTAAGDPASGAATAPAPAEAPAAAPTAAEAITPAWRTRSTGPVTGEAPREGKTNSLRLLHRGGQTFITWDERTDLNGEIYRVYRAAAPIDINNLAQAQFLALVGKDSARYYSDRYMEPDAWYPRFTERYIIRRGQPALDAGVGLMVWTLAPEDFGGQAQGAGYYAVTVTPAGGQESFSPDYSAGPVEESVQDPEPVEISLTPGIHPGDGGHFYTQFMDLRSWNPTFHAPNSTNSYLGLDPNDPNLANALAYAYTYSVFEPTDELCGGHVPDVLPVMVYLHGWRNNRYPSPAKYDNPSCAYGIYPIDQTQTWYFGFAKYHDFRKGGAIDAGGAGQPREVIENYTEQRVLRMVYDLLRKPPGPKADAQRVYVIGQSMGGTGSLAFAERYPNVFAAAYGGQPITDFRHGRSQNQDWAADVALKWGAPELNLPVLLNAPGGWAEPLQKYNGVGVWDWQNLQASFIPEDQPGSIKDRAADDMAPFGIDHGNIDPVIAFDTQAQPLYPMLNASKRLWAGGIENTEHNWTVYGYLPAGMAKINNVPFWNYGVRKDETLPGFSGLSSNPLGVPNDPTSYNRTILWSASWNAWDATPVDQPTQWQMSFCSVAAGDTSCGSGDGSAVGVQTVSITPRRTQQFKPQPGKEYTWQNLSGGNIIASGKVSADANGLITVPDFQVMPEGSRLVIHE